MIADVINRHFVRDRAGPFGVTERSIVLNNARYSFAGVLEGMTGEQIVRLLNTNMLGTIRKQLKAGAKAWRSS